MLLIKLLSPRVRDRATEQRSEQCSRRSDDRTVLLCESYVEKKNRKVVGSLPAPKLLLYVRHGTGEIAQGPRAFSSPTWPFSITPTPVLAQCPFLSFAGNRHACGAHVQVKHSHTENKVRNYFCNRSIIMIKYKLSTCTWLEWKPTPLMNSGIVQSQIFL